MWHFVTATQVLHASEYNRISVSEQYETGMMNIYSRSIYLRRLAFPQEIFSPVQPVIQHHSGGPS
jgi:hypothetical protein